MQRNQEDKGDNPQYQLAMFIPLTDNVNIISSIGPQQYDWNHANPIWLAVLAEKHQEKSLFQFYLHLILKTFLWIQNLLKVILMLEVSLVICICFLKCFIAFSFFLFYSVTNQYPKRPYNPTADFYT